jgi:RNA methyltransferase, TrmH family
MAPLTSTRNPRVRAWAALSRARERRSTGLHLAEGPTIVALAAAAGLVEEVVATEHATIPQVDAPVTLVTEHVLRHISDAVTPQQVVAVVRTPSADLESVVGDGLLVILDEVADPGNVGTLVRTAHAFGARAVVTLDAGADPFSPKCVRASAGSVYAIPVVTGIDWHEVLEACRHAGQTTVGLAASAPAPVETLAGRRRLALVLGSEAHGLRDADALDEQVSIPMPGGAESLNVAVAGAIALYAASLPPLAQAPRSDPASSQPRGTRSPGGRGSTGIVGGTH